MAQSATTKQGDFFVSLVKEAEILDGPVDLGSFGETTIQLHSLEDLCLAMMPLVSDPDARLEEFNAVFSAAADWDNVEDLLGELLMISRFWNQKKRCCCAPSCWETWAK